MTKKSNLPNRLLLIGFLIVECIIYLLFLSIDITGNVPYGMSNILKYCGIILCFLFTLLFYSGIKGTMDVYFLRGALFFTMVSDLFILILDYYNIGVFTFCIVQLLYLIRLYLWRKQVGYKKGILVLFLRNGIVILFVFAALVGLKMQIDGLILITIIYFTGIVINTVDALILGFKLKRKQQMFFAAGMFLFLLCDINVGLYNISGYINLDSVLFTKIYAFASIAMWMFYLPAQVVIALSGDWKNR